MPTPEEVKAEIMLKLEKLVDQVLETGKKPLRLTEIEELVLEVSGKIEADLTHRLLSQQSSQVNPVIPECPLCGVRMHRKGKKKRYLRTRSGDIEVERAYFYCQTCRSGYFSPG